MSKGVIIQLYGTFFIQLARVQVVFRKKAEDRWEVIVSVVKSCKLISIMFFHFVFFGISNINVLYLQIGSVLKT